MLQILLSFLHFSNNVDKSVNSASNKCQVEILQFTSNLKEVSAVLSNQVSAKFQDCLKVHARYNIEHQNKTLRLNGIMADTMDLITQVNNPSHRYIGHETSVNASIASF